MKIVPSRRALLLLALCAMTLSPSRATHVRDDNGGNCIGVKSCRPRCITFRVDRTEKDCSSSTGIFSMDGTLNPWDINRFEMYNCKAANTCINELCGQDLGGDLTIRIGEQGTNLANYFTSISLPAEKDSFTFCSIYPCPKEECAVPEQLGSGLQFDLLRGSVGLDERADSLLKLELYLKQDFVGSPLKVNGTNRFGPLHVEWMDDPTGCRTGDFSPFAPIAPLSDPSVLTNSSILPQSLYCQGDDYNFSPLPQTGPPMPPTTAPSVSPSTSLAPTPGSTYTAIAKEQRAVLQSLYTSTVMSSSMSFTRHNWFTIPDYCSFTGVSCDSTGYVIALDLTDRRLGGSLPSDITRLSRLRQLRLVNNAIGGTIPSQLSQLSGLYQVELGSNSLTGTIPSEFGNLKLARRLLFQNNKLNGTIPKELCTLDKLIAFDISSNLNMYGEIPTCFSKLSSLEVLRVQDVGLVGEIPSKLCRERPFNGLSLNVYGCSVIACPAGSFEPTIGRSDGNRTTCSKCRNPSNVIGSTTCKVVDGNNVVTFSPTTMPQPSSVPSMSPSFAPTRAPSVAPTRITRHPSREPSPTPSYTSSVPSPSPSLTILSSSLPSTNQPTVMERTAVPTPKHTTRSATPTYEPTSTPTFEATVTILVPTIEPTAPTIEPTRTVSPSGTLTVVRVTVLFAHVSDIMTNVTDIETFERTTLEFLRSHVPQETTTVTLVEILTQTLRIPDKNTTTGVTRSLGATTHMSRWLAAVKQMQDNALLVQIQIEGVTKNDTSSFEDVVMAALDKDEAYIKALSRKLPLFSTNITVDEKLEEPIPQTNTNERQINWWLLGSSVTLSVGAIAAVVVVRRFRYLDRMSEQASYAEPQMRPVTNSPLLNAQGSRSEESSGGWKSEESSEDTEDLANPESSVSAWTQNHELCLIRNDAPESLV